MGDKLGRYHAAVNTAWKLMKEAAKLPGCDDDDLWDAVLKKISAFGKQGEFEKDLAMAVVNETDREDRAKRARREK